LIAGYIAQKIQKSESELKVVDAVAIRVMVQRVTWYAGWQKVHI
jgi:hypothetical protein